MGHGQWRNKHSSRNLSASPKSSLIRALPIGSPFSLPLWRKTAWNEGVGREWFIRHKPGRIADHDRRAEPARGAALSG